VFLLFCWIIPLPFDYGLWEQARAGMPEMAGNNIVLSEHTIKVYKCPNPDCGEEIKPHWNQCPTCGGKIIFGFRG
jgi:DNA-directed RNA polymerase subunit RPC12/RpoP